MVPQQPATESGPSNPSSTTSRDHRKIAIAVDLSDESAYAVRWAVHNYLRPGDSVILLHVSPTSVLYGADWGSVHLSDSTSTSDSEQSHQKREDDFAAFTAAKAADLAQPLADAGVPFKIHIVKDHDMKERLCLEVERLGLSAVIMGSRGVGAVRRAAKGRLGSVSDYCVHHCVCPVVVVRYLDEKDDVGGGAVAGGEAVAAELGLHPVPEEEQEYHDASDDPKDSPVLSMSQEWKLQAVRACPEKDLGVLLPKESSGASGPSSGSPLKRKGIDRQVIGARLSSRSTPPLKVARKDGTSRGASPSMLLDVTLPTATPPVETRVCSHQATPSATTVTPESPSPATPSAPRLHLPHSGTSTGVPSWAGPMLGNPLVIREKLGRFVFPPEVTQINTLGTEGIINTFLEGLAQMLEWNLGHR